MLHGNNQTVAKSVDHWPRVRFHVIESHYAGSWRDEENWPLPGTVRTKYHLGNTGSLLSQPISGDESVQYEGASGGTSWKITFPERTEITGSCKLHLNFAVGEGATDADVFVTVQKLDRDGNAVLFPFHTFVHEGQVAYGWLRASKRTLDHHPVEDEVAHTFTENDARALEPNKFVELDINIQPSATLFRKNESLVLAVQGHDFGTWSEQCQLPRGGAGLNTQASHIIALKGSFLEVPIIPSWIDRKV